MLVESVGLSAFFTFLSLFLLSCGQVISSTKSPPLWGPQPWRTHHTSASYRPPVLQGRGINGISLATFHHNSRQ